MQLSTNDEAATAAATRDAWSATCDALLSGLAHALSNRVASLNAVVTMSADGAAAAGFSLDHEIARLNELLQLLRALAARPAGRVVALDASALVAQAVALHATHSTLRDVPVRIEDAGGLPPVFAPEGALTRAVLLALTGARAEALAARHPGVVVRCGAQPGGVTIEVAPALPDEATRGDERALEADALAGAHSSPEGRAAHALLAASGGAVRERSAGDYLISVPVVRPRAGAAR